jgi:hypothetical protein
LVGKPEERRPLGRSRHRWEDIRIELRKTGWEGVNCTHQAQDRDQWHCLVKKVTNLQVP